MNNLPKQLNKVIDLVKFSGRVGSPSLLYIGMIVTISHSSSTMTESNIKLSQYTMANSEHLCETSVETSSGRVDSSLF